MLGKVKKWLGIEGVKVELQIPETFTLKDEHIEGTLIFTSMNDQMVDGFRLKLIEKYSRGRRKNKLVDEYKMGELVVDEEIEVIAGEELVVPFDLPFKIVHSEMDDIERKFFLFVPFVKTAKLIKGVKSEYRIEVEADVQGTKLDPFDKKTIRLKG
jgi:hypothetical protein